MVSATDLDTNPDFSKVNYKFAEDVSEDILEYFELNSDGIFFLKKSVKGHDNEFVFGVTAFDNPMDLDNSNSKIKTITIKITRDYPPQFPGKETLYTKLTLTDGAINNAFTLNPLCSMMFIQDFYEGGV